MIGIHADLVATAVHTVPLDKKHLTVTLFVFDFNTLVKNTSGHVEVISTTAVAGTGSFTISTHGAQLLLYNNSSTAAPRTIRLYIYCCTLGANKACTRSIGQRHNTSPRLRWKLRCQIDVDLPCASISPPSGPAAVPLREQYPKRAAFVLAVTALRSSSSVEARNTALAIA